MKWLYQLLLWGGGVRPGCYEKKNSPELQILRQIPPILCEIRDLTSAKYIIAPPPSPPTLHPTPAPTCRRQTMVEITDSAAAAAGGSLSSIPGNGDKTFSHFLFVLHFTRRRRGDIPRPPHHHPRPAGARAPPALSSLYADRKKVSFIMV